MKVNTLLFDLDGTLIDTNELIITSFLHTLDHYYPGQYTREDAIQFIGPPLYDTFFAIDENRVQEMITTYRTHNLSHHDELVTEFEGVYETIEALYNKGYKLGIVTTKMRNAVDLGLKLTKLDTFFDCIVALDDVKHAKPHPEPVEKALALLDSKPEETIMVGDNYHDIEAGKNAGTLTAGVAWSLKGVKFLQTYKPDYMLHNMKDLLTILEEN